MTTVCLHLYLYLCLYRSFGGREATVHLSTLNNITKHHDMKTNRLINIIIYIIYIYIYNQLTILVKAKPNLTRKHKPLHFLKGYNQGRTSFEWPEWPTGFQTIYLGGPFFFFAAVFQCFFGFLVLCFPVSLIFCFSASLLTLLLCFSAFCFPCFSAFPALLFCFLLFLLLCFSALCFPCFSAFVLLCLSTSTILLFRFFSHVFLLLNFLLLCFFASCLFCLFVSHFLLLYSVLFVS